MIRNSAVSMCPRVDLEVKIHLNFFFCVVYYLSMLRGRAYRSCESSSEVKLMRWLRTRTTNLTRASGMRRARSQFGPEKLRRIYPLGLLTWIHRFGCADQ